MLKKQKQQKSDYCAYSFVNSAIRQLCAKKHHQCYQMVYVPVNLSKLKKKNGER